MRFQIGGEGTPGKLINEENLFRDARATLKKAARALEGLGEAGRITAGKSYPTRSSSSRRRQARSVTRAGYRRPFFVFVFSQRVVRRA
jgi:beta-phosphoglucomutase-like phosphatase (HAD superfamily)